MNENGASESRSFFMDVVFVVFGFRVFGGQLFETPTTRRYLGKDSITDFLANSGRTTQAYT